MKKLQGERQGRITLTPGFHGFFLLDSNEEWLSTAGLLINLLRYSLLTLECFCVSISATIIPRWWTQSPPTPSHMHSGIHWRQSGNVHMDFGRKSQYTFSFFFKIYIYCLMWIILKVFIEFVTILLWFYALVFGLQGMWDPSSPTTEQTHTLHWKVKSLLLDCQESPTFFSQHIIIRKMKYRVGKHTIKYTQNFYTKLKKYLL